MNRLVITGGNGDLAQAMAKAFDYPLWEVLAPGRFELDVTNDSDVRDYFNERSVDLLICAAGIIRDRPLARLDEATWDQVLATNYHGAAGCAVAALEGMARSGRGHVVFISSHSALHPPAGQAAYAASKAALLGLTAALAKLYGPVGVRVNAVLPGFMETKMTADVAVGRKTKVLSEHVLGRFNTPSAVGKFIRFLHDELPHTSGQIFRLDSRVS